jgi:hypothetical protein
VTVPCTTAMSGSVRSGRVASLPASRCMFSAASLACWRVVVWACHHALSCWYQLVWSLARATLT